MNISVIGCGRWGSFLAWYLSQRLGHSVLIQGRSGSASFEGLKRDRKNEYVVLSERVNFTASLKDALSASEVIVISVNAQGFPALLEDIKAVLEEPKTRQITENTLSSKTFILCMKGLLEGSGRRLSEQLYCTLGEKARCIAWVGPGHPEDFCSGIPNCMLLASRDEALAHEYSEKFSSELIRLYYSGDIVGCEIGAAAKNVIGIAAGMLDGMKLSSLKGSLMARGPREIARLATALGGDERSIFGLSHLGDYEATLFSAHSHNRRYGEDFISNKKYDKLAEGVYTVRSLMTLSEKTGIELPICSAVNELLYNGGDPKKTLSALFMRSLKSEF